MKHTFVSILTAAFLASSAVVADSSTINFSGYKDTITCDTELTLDGTSDPQYAGQPRAYGFAISEGVVGEGNATLLYKWTQEGSLSFTGKITDMGGLYDVLSGKLYIDPSKTYNVYAFQAPGAVLKFVNGKFIDYTNVNPVEVDVNQIVTNTGKFPPDSSKSVPFVASKCSAQQLPESSSV